ncbi:hypothetical protein QQ020_14410 [Fulvivirgaceae bacterium BMA12]|uniref:Uncharacterized protein n=1 Tax=Agaribacillus aureus TaxID=3051825 RepID=A0ABT8LAF9_9BACT|nr:hypothetical protein [Fulvivirgaceae bacterium BMA12]
MAKVLIELLLSLVATTNLCQNMGGRPTSINFDDDNNQLNGVIFSGKKNLFPDITDFEGQEALITGIIFTYKGNLQLILNDQSQQRMK